MHMRDKQNSLPQSSRKSPVVETVPFMLTKSLTNMVERVLEIRVDVIAAVAAKGRKLMLTEKLLRVFTDDLKRTPQYQALPEWN